MDQSILSGALFDDAGMVRGIASPEIERVQIITAKPGDTIAVMSDAYMSAQERLLLIALFQAKLPEGVKVMVLDRGVKLVHVEAGTPRPIEDALALRQAGVLTARELRSKLYRENDDADRIT